MCTGTSPQTQQCATRQDGCHHLGQVREKNQPPHTNRTSIPHQVSKGHDRWRVSMTTTATLGGTGDTAAVAWFGQALDFLLGRISARTDAAGTAATDTAFCWDGFLPEKAFCRAGCCQDGCCPLPRRPLPGQLSAGIASCRDGFLPNGFLDF